MSVISSTQYFKTVEEPKVEVGEVLKAVYNASKKYNVDMPIITEAYKIVYENKNPRDCVMDLMTRDMKSEL